jgi:hypothetical protein
MSRRGRHLLAVATAVLGLGCAIGSEPPPFSLLRYDESWRHDDGGPLVLGGEAREKVVYRRNELFGSVPGEFTSFQQRYLLHADAVLGPQVRFFAQLLSDWEDGRKPRALPTDEDKFDAAQLFAEWHTPAGEAFSQTVRVGRQEILWGGHQILTIREGPNVRQSFDATRWIRSTPGWRLDAFAGNPVAPRPGTFDDRWLNPVTSLWGANVVIPRAWAGLRADIFYLGYRNRRTVFQEGAGREQRHSFGARLDGKRGPWELNYEVTAQGGEFAGGDIRAWGAATFTGYRFAALSGSPKLTLLASTTSGDRQEGDGRLGTFNALFPRGDFFGEVAAVTGSNSTDLGLQLELLPGPHSRLVAQINFLSRTSLHDGLYSPPVILVRRGSATAPRALGQQFTVSAAHDFNRSLSAELIAAYLVAGDFPKSAGLRADTTAITSRLQFKF